MYLEWAYTIVDGSSMESIIVEVIRSDPFGGDTCLVEQSGHP